jgi:hypothetical protein
MQTRPYYPESRKVKILTTATFILKWTIILGAAQAFAALLVFTTFVNNYGYFKQGARGDVARLCAPYIQSLQKHK